MTKIQSSYIGAFYKLFTSHPTFMRIKQPSIICFSLLLICFANQLLSNPDSLSLQIKADQLWGVFNTERQQKNYDKALETLDQIERTSRQMNKQDYVAFTYMSRAMCHYSLEEFDSLKKVLNEGMVIVDRLSDTIFQKEIRVHFNYYYGGYHLKHWNLEAALYYFQLIVTAEKEKVSIEPLTKMKTYNNVGLIFRRMEDYERAISYYLHSLRFIPAKKRAIPYQNIARAYLLSNQTAKAREYFHLAFQTIADQNITRKPSLKKKRASIYRNYAEYFIALNQPDSAHYYIDLSLQEGTDILGKINSHQRKGNAYLIEQQYAKAHKQFQKALSLSKTHRRNIETAETFYTIGKYLQEQEKLDSALVYFQQALVQVSVDSLPLDFRFNPATNSVISKSLSLHILKHKASVLNSIGRASWALKCYQTIDTLLTTMKRRDILTDESLYYFIAQSKEIYIAAIETALSLNKKEQAFLFAQQTHSPALLRKTQHNVAKKIGLPDSLLAKERQLSIDLNDLKIQLSKGGPSEDTRQALGHQLFLQQQTYDQFIAQLEKKYEPYYQAKYQASNCSIEALQQVAKSQEAVLIEYVVAPTQLYAFVISDKELKIITLPADQQLATDITFFKQLASKPSMELTPYSLFCKIGYELYRDLLQPILEDLPSPVENIIIIPDEYLNHIPFVALLENPVTINKVANYATLPFLVKRYHFSYNYASTFFCDIQQKDRTPTTNLNNFIGFAPSFSGVNSSSRNLDSLLYNISEVEAIKKIIGGKLYKEEEAITQIGKEALSTTKVLHFATHVSLNDTMPLLSKIFFYDGFLLLSEIYYLKNALELVVLSACDTGIGLLRKGEGMISFARAFFQSGCKSIVTSLWKVNDRQTPELMEQFYLNLEKGMPKNQALSQAQRTYLAQTLTLADAHPYYWANFILIGDTEAIQFNKNFVYFSIGLFTLLLLIGCFVVYISERVRECECQHIVS